MKILRFFRKILQWLAKQKIKSLVDGVYWAIVFALLGLLGKGIYICFSAELWLGLSYMGLSIIGFSLLKRFKKQLFTWFEENFSKKPDS